MRLQCHIRIANESEKAKEIKLENKSVQSHIRTENEYDEVQQMRLEKERQR